MLSHGDLRQHWNRSSNTIPDDKDPSAYAVEKEQLFPRHSIVCDLGGGSGADGLYFATKGHVVMLVDISDMALDRAMNTAAVKGLADSIKTFQSDLSGATIPLESGTCDVVYSRLALHYFNSSTLSKLFAEVYRILKPGGKAHLTLKSPNDKAEMEYLKRQANELEAGVFEEGGYLKTRFTIAQLETIIDDAGIETGDRYICQYTEALGNRKDRVKSGNAYFTVNEIELSK